MVAALKTNFRRVLEFAQRGAGRYSSAMKIRSLALLVCACLSVSLSARAQSSRPGMGAIVYADANGTGVTFRTWAPNATTVVVKGSFNGWGSTALKKDPPGGTWSVDVPNARANQEYKFVINGTHKKDPRGFRVVNSAGNSIIYDHRAFDWGSSTNFQAIWRNDLVIYEMHVGSYNAESWLPSTFDQCIEKIPYLKALGISAVELMPTMEFPGDRSWGYNPSDLYAIESSFGGPDGLKRFVKACHENGIAVIMDVVHNHYGPSDLEMWQYDGWSQNGLGGIYFYNEKWKAQTDWGDTRPDFGRPEVKNFIHDQIRMLVEKYKIDGFRWDSVYNIRNYSGSENPEGAAMLAKVNDWLAEVHPNVFRIAEDHAFDTPVNFEAQWDHGFLNAMRWLVTASSDTDRNMDALAYHLSNGGFYRVVYVESHDTCGDLNDKHRLPRDIHFDDPQGYWAKKRALLGNMIALISPGIPMIFAGSEMNEDWTFSNNTALRWSLTNSNAGIVRAYSDLIRLRRDKYGNTTALKQVGKANVTHVNNTQKIVGVVRWDQGGQSDDVLLALNCSATAQNNYSLPFPSDGTWHCLYNSDLKAYDASFGGVGPGIGGTVVASGGNAKLNLGAYSLQVYSKTPIPQMSAASFHPPNPSGCGTVVTITYNPGDGALKQANPVYAYIGRNVWQYPSNHLMTLSNGLWKLDYAVPNLTYEFNLSFTDGAGNWDNNEGLNWAVPVSNCGDLPSTATWEPHVPQGCMPLTIVYHPNGGPLMGATNAFIHVGQNGWNNVTQLPLAQFGENEWRITYSIPEDTWQVDFVFFTQTGPGEGDRTWDNNNGKNWQVMVQNCLRVNEPSLFITNPPPSTNVAEQVKQIALQGTAHLLTGHLHWSNSLNGATGSIAYATNWSIGAIPLAEGVNLIRVSGTNSSVNPNHGAGDSPANTPYITATNWVNGQNGGTGLQPWRIRTSGGSSASTVYANTNCSFAPTSYAWALQAADGGFVEAIRPLSAPLRPGDKLTLVMQNGGVDGGKDNSSIGVAFENRFGQRLTEFLFNGGYDCYYINDAVWRDTGIPWGRITRNITLEMLTELTYRLTINGQAFEGELKEQSEMLLAQLRFWNWNAGGGDQRKLFIGTFSIQGDPLPVFTYSAETAVTRAWSSIRETTAVTIADGDLVATVNNLTGINSNVWVAHTLSNQAWNWSLLPNDQYIVVPSNRTVVITPNTTNALNLYSLGKPGGVAD